MQIGISAGTRLTADTAMTLGRPLMYCAMGGANAGFLTDITDWIGEHQISALNIAGPRESECPGIYAAAHDLILNLLTEFLRQ